MEELLNVLTLTYVYETLILTDIFKMKCSFFTYIHKYQVHF